MTPVLPDISPGGRYSPTQAAKLLEVSKKTLWENARQGNIKYSVNKSGYMRFKGIDLISYWKTR